MTKKGGKMRWCIVGLLVCVIFSSSVASSSVKALDTNGDWEDTPLVVTSKIELDDLPEHYPCEGAQGYVQVKGMGEFKDACIQGIEGRLKIARFIHEGIYKYGVSFPTDSSFYELKGVCSHPRCVYSAQSDTFIDHTYLPPGRYGGILYKDFSKNLVKQVEPFTLRSYFQFIPTSSYMIKMGEYIPSVEALAISLNGKWAAVEIKSYGIVRVNIETLEVKRVIAPGAEYGLGFDPTFEMAITNDGREVALMGRGAAIGVVHITDACGDSLVQGMESHFAANITPCPSAPINTSQLFPGLRFAESPRFNELSTELKLIARYTNGAIEKVVTSPFPAINRPSIPYLALGDSFTSGEGESSDTFYQSGTTDPPFKCHVSNRSYPYLLGRGWSMPTKNIACSGAQTVDIVSNQYTGQGNSLKNFSDSARILLEDDALGSFHPGIITQSEFVSTYQPQFVSVAIGGNDAGLVGKLAGCLGIGTCEWAKEPLKKYATSQEIAAIYPKIREVLKKLRADSPISQIVVIGYPQIINPSEAAHCSDMVATLLNGEERQFIYQTIHYLNEVVKAAAAAEGFAFVDIEESLKGHELCGAQDSTAMNAVRLGDDIAPIQNLPDFMVFGAESFHPTPIGHALIASSILRQYPSTSSIAVCGGSCSPGNSPPPPSSYWAPQGGEEIDYIKQINENSISEPVLRVSDQVNFRSPSLFFAPLSKVQVELHSDTVDLGEATANSEGSVEFVGTLPPSIPTGYHVLHLLGTTPSGEAIDVYRTIFIQPEEKKNSTAFISNKSSLTQRGAAITDKPANGGGILSADILGVSKDQTLFKTPYFSKDTIQPKKTEYTSWILNGIIVLILIIVGFVSWFSFRRHGG